MIKNEELKLLREVATNAYTLRRELIQKMLDDTRDLNTECGYPNTIGTDDYQLMFDRNGVGTRVVKLWPEECWNVLPDVTEGEETEESTFEKKWKELDKKHSLCSHLYRLDVLSGIGRYGVLLIGISDGKPLDEPVDGIDLKTGEIAVPKKYELTYLKPMSETVITVKDKETEATSPRFGLPTRYTVKTESMDGEMSAGETEVHWTRVLHVVDNKGVSDVFGTPRLMNVYNYCLDLKKLLGGSAEMFWKGGFPGYGFKVNPDRQTPLTTEEKTDFRAEMLNFTNKLQRYFIMTGVEVESMNMQVADPSNHFMTQIKAIAVTLGVPYRKLLGTEESKLAGSEDTKTWNRRVAKRQNDHVTPVIVRPFVDRLIGLGAMPPSETYEVVWPSLDELDPKDAATVAKDTTEAIAKYVAAGCGAVMPPHQFLTTVLSYTDKEAKAILKAAETWVNDQDDEPDELEPEEFDA